MEFRRVLFRSPCSKITGNPSSGPSIDAAIAWPAFPASVIVRSYIQASYCIISYSKACSYSDSGFTFSADGRRSQHQRCFSREKSSDGLRRVCLCHRRSATQTSPLVRRLNGALRIDPNPVARVRQYLSDPGHYPDRSRQMLELERGSVGHVVHQLKIIKLAERSDDKCEPHGRAPSRTRVWTQVEILWGASTINN